MDLEITGFPSTRKPQVSQHGISYPSSSLTVLAFQTTLLYWSYGSLTREVCGWCYIGSMVLKGVSGGLFTNGTHMPDWVDSSVATWIQSETEKMDTVWGPSEQRSALAFVHIPPWISCSVQSQPLLTVPNRHLIQAVQESLNNSANPGLNGTPKSVLRFTPRSDHLEADTLGQGSTQASLVPASLGRDNDFWHSLNTNVKNLRAVISGHGEPSG